MWVLIREKWTKWKYHGDRLRRPCGRSYHQVQRIYLQYEPSAFPMGIACRRLCVLIQCYPFRRFPSESLPSRNSKHASEIRIWTIRPYLQMDHVVHLGTSISSSFHPSSYPWQRLHTMKLYFHCSPTNLHGAC